MPDVLFSPIIPKATPKGNKVGIINFPEAEQQDHHHEWPNNARSSMGKENVQTNCQAEDRVNFKKRAGGTRSGLAVAKSLAVPSFSMGLGGAGQDVKYNWLFNDDETPRDDRHDEIPPPNRELIRKDKYMANNEEVTTQANSNFVAHSGPFKQSDQCQNLTDTLASHRQDADDVLIHGNNG